MIIYKKDNSVRLQVHQSDDSEMIQEISGEEYVLFKFESNVFTTFEVGDYITVYGQTFTLKKVVAPIDKSGTNRFDYTLKFKSTRDDLGEVNFQLFDNTTISVVPAYNPSTTYSQGDVVSYHTLHWKYISSTPTSGNAPAENEYWAIKSTITSYVPPYNSATTYTYGDTVDYNNNYFMHIGSVDTVGVAPVEGEHWTVIKTAPMWDFSTILTPTRYAQLIVDNMNRARPNQTWTVGYCIPAEPKESTFSNVKCLDAASSIAELFETEFWVDGYSVNFGKRSNVTSITMQFGKGGGFTKVIRNEVTESRKVTRLIALGGEANLLGTYRNGSKRLMLPNRYYLDADNIDLSSPLEDTQTWDDIIPTMQHATEDYDHTKTYYAGNQVLYSGYSWDCIATATGVTPTQGAYWKYSEGTVTNAVSQYKLIDKNLTFDPLDMQYRMTDGTIPKVKFFTGNLAGYEFPITGYNNATKQITIEQISDGTNSLLPTASYGFKVGDRFGFVDLYMPASYVAKAEQRLLAKAQEFLEKYSKDQISYSGDVDEIWATNGDIELHIGDIIHFVDADFNISLDYRIIKVTRNLTRQYKYSIELSTLPYIPSKITSITNKVTQNETYIDANGLKGVKAVTEKYSGNDSAMPMFRGEWNASNIYVGNQKVYHVVNYDGKAYRTLKSAGVFSQTDNPSVDENHWELFDVTVDTVATGLLLAQEAWIGNLIVSRLGTSANPYAGRFANVGSGIGIFRNLDDESSIDNAIIGMGKDISIAQQTGERKPAFVVRDKQWRGTYSASTIYYNDDRVYYSSHLGAATWSSAASYNIGTYVTYNSTVWVCTVNNSGYKPYVGSPYWNADGATYIFTKDWLETDTPSAGYLPTNYSYWQYLASGNLGGGSYSELGSEGMFSNGSNIMGFSVATGITSNFSAAYLLQKRNSNSNGISAAVLGMDQTDETDGPSKSYGGYFNSAYIGRVVHNIRNVSASGAILKSDYRIHCYNTSTITLTMPTPDNSMVGQTIKFRKLGAQTVYITTSTSYKFWHISELTTLTLGDDDGFSVTWDGAYWVTEFTNQ